MTEFKKYILSKIIEVCEVNYTVEEFDKVARLRLFIDPNGGITNFFQKEGEQIKQKEIYNQTEFEKTLEVLINIKNHYLNKRINWKEVEEWVKDYNNARAKPHKIPHEKPQKNSKKNPEKNPEKYLKGGPQKNRDCKRERLNEEIGRIIVASDLDCSVEDFGIVLSPAEWVYVSCYKYLSEDFIREFRNFVNWDRIACHQILSEHIIEEFQDRFDWKLITMYQNLSDEFIIEHQDKIDFAALSQYKKMSESMIEKFSDKVDWKFISIHQKLSEDFIRKYKDKVCWFSISYFQVLSEDFMREFSKKLNWRNISNIQKMSRKFMAEHFNLIFFDELKNNGKSFKALFQD